MSTVQVSSLLHSGYQHPASQYWQSDNTAVTALNLMLPIFVHNKPNKEPIEALPGVYRHSIESLHDFKASIEKGLRSVLLFGVPEETDLKDNRGTMADSDGSAVVKAIKFFKLHYPEVMIACDVCLCAYTDHGHCCVMGPDGTIDNQKSVERLTQVAKKFADTGCTLIAPSDMMDGRIASMKEMLLINGYGAKVAVMSYSAKFASAFYGPFRSAAGSKPSFGDRKCYQLPVGARGLARRAIIRDRNEGADILMVKPGYPYLDIVRDAKELVPDIPLAIYQVSGEYALLWNGADKGIIDLKDGVMESLVSARRAGATILITYFAPLVLNWINE